MKKLQRIVLAVALFAILFTTALPANAGAPTDQLKGTIDNILVVLQNDSFKGPANKAARRTALGEVVSKRFSFKEMSKRSLGKNWKKTTTDEKRAFVAAFKALIQNSYFTKMEQYTDEEINYTSEKIRGKSSAVKTIVITSSGTEIPIEYRMKINKKSEWMVYDIVVEGISLISNYRSSFASELKKSTIANLTASLEKKVAESRSK